MALDGREIAAALDILHHFLHFHAEFLLPGGSPHEIVEVLQVENFEVKALLDDAEKLLFGL